MEFHPQKCQAIYVSRSRNPLHHQYILHGQFLESVPSAKYLGITITKDLTWSQHILNVSNKANSTLGFLRRSLKINSSTIKERAYMTLVRPNLEYCSSVWDPSTAVAKYNLERVQRRTARWVLHRYHNTSSVTDMLNHLQWQTLERRRKDARLIMMYKIVNGLVAINPHQYLTPVVRQNRFTHPHSFLQIPAAKESFRQSFFPRTVNTWNGLAPNLVTAPTHALNIFHCL